MKQTMPSVAVATVMLIVNHVGAQTISPSSFFEGPAECSLNAGCGDLEKDCCPTIDGVYLNCCFEGNVTDYPSFVPSDTPVIQSDSPSFVPSSTPSFVPSGSPTFIPTDVWSTSNTSNTSIFVGPAECSMNSACADLAEDCCPTSDGEYLACCFQKEAMTLFSKEFSFVGADGHDEVATFFASTSNYTINATAPDGSYPVVYYTRNADEVYDLIYYATDDSIDPFDYINGTKKFYLDVYSTAAPCTHVLLQLDSLPLAEADYPIGRHSRFIAFTNSTYEWERLAFEFLDIPDLAMDLDDTDVNSIVLFFNPGTNTSDTFFFRNLDSAVAGCDELTETCEDVVSTMCLASILGENCTDFKDSWDDEVECAELFAFLLGATGN